MEITIVVNEDDVQKAVTELVIQRALDTVEAQLFGGERYSIIRRLYAEGIKDQTREMLKAHLDDIIDRAVECAGAYIGKKGLKKMIDEEKI